jgi:hypothetical protein
VRARDLRDDAALAVLPILVARLQGTAGELTRRTVVREAFAYADEVVLQRAVDMGATQDSTLVPNYTDTCVQGHKQHLWSEQTCKRCLAITPPHIVIRKRYEKNKREREKMARLYPHEVRKEA